VALRADNLACGLASRPPDPSASRDGPINPSRAWLMVTLFGDLAAYPTLSGPFVVFRGLGACVLWLGCCSSHPRVALSLSSAVWVVVFGGWAVCQSHLGQVGVADLGRPHHLAPCLLPRNREIRPPGAFPGDQIPDLATPINTDGALHGGFLPVTSLAPPGMGQKSPASGKSRSPQCLHSE